MVRGMSGNRLRRGVRDEALAVIIAPNNHEKQPHDMSGGYREHRTKGGAPGDRSEHGGASDNNLSSDIVFLIGLEVIFD